LSAGAKVKLEAREKNRPRHVASTAATSQNAANAQINPSTGFYNGSGGASGGVKITHYGYAGDSTPDWNSEHGIGNHNNQQVPGTSIAFSPDLIAEHHLTVGQAVTVTFGEWVMKFRSSAF
jgi:hypothetical protein